MNLTVEWVGKSYLLCRKQRTSGQSRIPVIRVDALRRWLEHERELSVFNEERGYVQIDDLLAKLPEGESSPSIGR